MEKTELTKINCDMCGALWLGHFYNQPLCNDCRIAALEDEQMKHQEAPNDETIDAMYDSMVGSGSKEYRTAHE